MGVQVLRFADLTRWEGHTYAGIVRINHCGVPAYRSGDRCGFCGGSGWHVGRITAECSNPRCGNAVMRDHP